MKKYCDPFWLVFVGTLIVWVFCFRIFLFREAPLTSDAVSFYDHLKFYIDQVIRGVYPLWDPFWSCGSPNEFFLRRIGPFNPLLLFIAIPYKLGVSFWVSFASFLTIYYFLGMLGFYKLALEILKDKNSALMAFVLLSLSSLGTRVFDSYMMMFMMPMIWFFYFLLALGRPDQPILKYRIAGLVFCVMLLMTTYIPFYFIVIVLTFLLFFIPIFPKETGRFLSRLFIFIKKNPVFMVVCFLALILSCAPGYLFFKHASVGDFAMPLRHFNSTAQNELSVEADVTSYWAIPEDLLFAFFYLEDLRLFDFAVIYVPFFSTILLLMGLATSLNRRLIIIFGWGFFLLLMGSPYWIGLYEYLHQHIFFFKYFRNLHFFLWLAILPLFILFIVEQAKLYLNSLSQSKVIKKRSFLFIILVHVALAGLLMWRGSFNYSTWIVLGLSLLAFLLLSVRRISLQVFYGLCLIIIVIQPLEVAYHLNRNTLKYVALSIYDQFSSDFQYTRHKKTVLLVDPKDRPAQSEGRNNPLYFGTQWFNLLWDHIDYPVLNNYTFTKFIVYDRVAAFDETRDNLRMIEQSWRQEQNMAYVPPAEMATEDMRRFEKNATAVSPIMIDKESREFRVVKSHSNGVKIETNFAEDKFLVFNDGYYPGWAAFLDDKPVFLYRANIAFKGVVIPAGKRIVEFRFGETSRYVIELGILFFYYLFFFGFIWLWWKGRHD